MERICESRVEAAEMGVPVRRVEAVDGRGRVVLFCSNCRTLLARFMGYGIYRGTDFPLEDISTYHTPHPVKSHLLALVRSHRMELMGWIALELM